LNRNGTHGFCSCFLAVEETSAGTFRRILAIRKLPDETTALCRENLPRRIYSRKPVEMIFVPPYSKIPFLVDAGIAKRQTAAEYLQQLEEIGVPGSRKNRA